LVYKRAEEWMKKRKVTDSKSTAKEKHVEFAKELFKIWDSDSSGSLDLEELTLQLVSLGLSTD
jgi:Ca2+-binding EF-hand superfamily protein